MILIFGHCFLWVADAWGEIHNECKFKITKSNSKLLGDFFMKIYRNQCTCMTLIADLIAEGVTMFRVFF